VLNVDMCGKDQDCDLRELGADGAAGIKTLGALTGRHTDIDDGKVRRVTANSRQQLGGVATFGDDLQARTIQQRGQSRSQEHVVLSNHNPDQRLVHG